MHCQRQLQLFESISKQKGCIAKAKVFPSQIEIQNECEEERNQVVFDRLGQDEVGLNLESLGS